MKRSLPLSLIVTFALTVAFIIFSIFASEDTPPASTANCETLPARSVNSQRALGAIIDNKQVFAVRLKQEGEKNFSPPGGHVNPKEEPKKALIREIQEETSVRVTPESLEPYKTTCATKNGGIERTYYFIVNTDIKHQLPKNPSFEYLWSDSTYLRDKNFDTELNQLVYLLKADNKIN
jgi:8-oxo-dGTP pyrophosphatase MutT (NUDIX family)